MTNEQSILTLWAQLSRAAHVYLQVMESDTTAPLYTPALLYASLGFETLYHYHYPEQT